MKPLPLSEDAPTFSYEGVNYQLLKTADGSPSLRMWSDNQRPEAMHHCDGALAESLYIYGSLVDEAIARGWLPPKILSVGLGCGYNEWIALATCNRSNITDCYIESFEANTLLRETFKEWLQNEFITQAANSFREILCRLFDEVLQHVSSSLNVNPNELKSFGRESFIKRKWHFRERLDASTIFSQKMNLIFFDAFSSKATPELWSENFLSEFLIRASDSACGFGTYAATGSLNRALKQAGFSLVPMPGFSGKRESTRAYNNHVTSRSTRHILGVLQS